MKITPAKHKQQPLPPPDGTVGRGEGTRGDGVDGTDPFCDKICFSLSVLLPPDGLGGLDGTVFGLRAVIVGRVTEGSLGRTVVLAPFPVI